MHSRQRGIAYIGLLLAVAVVGIFLGAAADVWTTTRQRQREAELLWIGNQFREAIAAYQNSPNSGASKAFPTRLEDLLEDPRSPVKQRYLRRIYPDPFTGKADWVLLMAPQGGIAGIRSKATGTPLKQTGFRPRDALFENKTSYADWQFTALPPVPAGGVPGMPGGAPGMPGGLPPGAGAPPGAMGMPPGGPGGMPSAAPGMARPPGT